jgi:hypothetical protein
MGAESEGPFVPQDKQSKRPFAENAQGKRELDGEVEMSRGMIARPGVAVNTLS